MPSVGLNGVDLWVEHDGRADGASVLFLHGLGSSASDWAFQRPVFAERHRVLTVDLRGHGRSRPARGRLTVERLARDVDEALAALGERAVHVVGLSLGGCVGLALAADHPARVRSLTLVNAFAKLRPTGPAGVARMLRRVATACVAPMPVVAAQVARTLFPRPEQAEAYRLAVASLSQNSRRTYLAAMTAAARFDARPRLASVRCPTLVVVGERDRTVPRAAAAALCRGIPGAQLLVVADSGHATPCDQPDLFNRAVLEFIARVGADGNSATGDTV
jgi:3-oxoadipate enol-lactonase